MKEKVSLGDKVRDEVTGFEGIVLGKSEFLYGCTRVGVQPKLGSDGKIIEASWFDEPQLKVIKKAVIKKQTKEQSEIGGPMPSVPTRNNYK